MSEPNQKFILIDKTSVSDKNFFYLNHETFFLAAKRLTLNGIRMYMYFMSLVPDSIDGVQNKKNTRTGYFELYTSKAAETMDISTQSVQRGTVELINKGYLVLRKGNLYQFIDILPEDKLQSPEEHQKVLNYQEELANSLKIMSDQREEQLQEIAKTTLVNNEPREKYEWED